MSHYLRTIDASMLRTIVRYPFGHLKQDAGDKQAHAQIRSLTARSA
jgi:hypothetical protein